MLHPKISLAFLFLIIFIGLFIIACDEEVPSSDEELVAYGGVKPDTLPSFAEIDLYSSSSPLNTPIGSNPSIDPDNNALVDKLVAGGDFLLSLKRYSSTVYIADASTPRHDVYLPCGSEWEMGFDLLVDVPIPDGAEPAFDGEPGDGQPFGCGEGSEQDNHMVVLDLEARCEYDFWQARKTTEGWYASWANSISLDSDGIYDHGLSTRGSGFAFLGGVIWPDELQSGHIDHALSFNSPYTKSGGPVSPATDSDGEINQTHAIPEGALFQLDPTLDLSSLNLTSYEMTIAEALQVYGMYLVDNGTSGVGLYAVDPKSVNGNPYAGVLPDEDWPFLSNIPLESFRVIEMGPQNGNYQDELDIVDSGCASFE